MKNTFTDEIIHSFDFTDNYRVDVVYRRWSGGGECWEYNVYDGDDMIHTTNDGHGSAAVTAAAAFTWLAEELAL